MALGACAVIVSSVYNLTLRNLTRFVTRAFPFRKGFAGGHSKYLAARYSQSEDSENRDVARMVSGKALDIILNRKGAIANFFNKVGLPLSGDRQDSLPALSSILSGATALLSNYWAMVPAAYHIGAYPSLAMIMSGAWVGSSFAALERVIGRALAVVVMAMLNGAAVYFTTVPIAIAACFAQIVGFIVKGMCNGALNLPDRASLA